MVHWVAEFLLQRLVRVIAAELPIFVDRARDDADVQTLGALRLAVDVEGEARLAAVAQPFLATDPVAFRLGDLLAPLVEEQLILEALGRAAAEDAGDLARVDAAVAPGL